MDRAVHEITLFHLKSLLIMRTTAANGIGMFDDIIQPLMTFGHMSDTPEEFEKAYNTMMDKYSHLKDDIKLEKVYEEDDTEKKYPTYKVWIRPAEVIFHKD